LRRIGWLQIGKGDFPMPVIKRPCERCVKSCKHGGTWWYDFCVRGKRYRKAVPEARTKWQAEHAEVKAKEAIFAGRYGSDPSNITLKEFVEKEFLPWAKDNKRSWKNDESRSKPILAYFKNKKMREISRFNVEQYRKARRASSNGRGGSRAPASVDREIQLMSRIFTLAIEREEVQINPCKGVKMLNRGNTVTRYLTPDEEERLLQVLTGRRRHLLDIIVIDLHTGMRRTEILTLHKKQIDFIRGSIEVIETKNGKPRSLPIHQALRPILQRLVEEAGPNGFLFENPKKGKPIRDIKTAWRYALRDARIEGLRFHDLRHTFGTRAIDGGAPLSAVKEVMGHMDIRTTMRYVHATDEGKRRAVEAAVSGGVKLESVTNPSHTLEATA
jgi:integrase